ncbi:unnamed protein product [Rotaria sp. Silwood1]|nr:unnamed protein product [Rotaria sp. Silwood1]
MQPVGRSSSYLSEYLPIKDPIPKLFKSNITSKLDCSYCEATYVGKKTQQICRRLQERGTNLIKEKETKCYSIDLIDNSSNVRRSQRYKSEIVHYFPKTHNELT